MKQEFQNSNIQLFTQLYHFANKISNPSTIKIYHKSSNHLIEVNYKKNRYINEMRKGLKLEAQFHDFYNDYKISS